MFVIILAQFPALLCWMRVDYPICGPQTEHTFAPVAWQWMMCGEGHSISHHLIPRYFIHFCPVAGETIKWSHIPHCHVPVFVGIASSKGGVLPEVSSMKGSYCSVTCLYGSTKLDQERHVIQSGTRCEGTFISPGVGRRPQCRSVVVDGAPKHISMHSHQPQGIEEFW